MRKKLWACAVAVAIVAVGGGVAVDYAWEHPNSLLGHCLFNSHTVAGFPVVPMNVASKAGVVAYNGVRGLSSQETTATWDHDPNRPPYMGTCEESEATEPALLPGAVVLSVEQDGLPAEAMPPVHDAVSVRGRAEACEDVLMPAVEDDTAVMPYVEDEFLPETYVPPQGYENLYPEWQGQKMQMRGSSSDETPAADDDCKKLFQNIECDGEKAKHHDIDTMEARPSDLWFLDFIGPF
jgi:hypothetical protein